MTLGATIARALNELTAAWSEGEETAAAELIDRMVPAQTPDAQKERAPRTAHDFNHTAPGAMHTTIGKDARGDYFELSQDMHRPPKRPAKEQDELFEALCGVCGIRWQEMTKAARGRVNGPLAQLREIGATPHEIRRRALAFVRLYPSIRPTPATIAARWPELGANTAITSDFRPEPTQEIAGWQNWLESAYPGNSYGPNGVTPCADWQRLPSHVQTLILRECPQARRAAG